MKTLDDIAPALRALGRRGIYRGGSWDGGEREWVVTLNPATNRALAEVAVGSDADVDAAVADARRGLQTWSAVPPLERAKTLRGIAALLREHAEELALIDAANCGNPVKEMVGDAHIAAAQVEFFAGLVTEMKGASIPMGPNAVNFSVREPVGVVGRIIPFNHPFMFAAGKSAAPLAAGNAVIVKPPDQAPLSSLRLAELLHGVLPPGVFNIVPGDRDTGAALAAHPDVDMIAIIGSASGPLLPWLRASVFPEESRFVAPAHATAVAEELCASLLAQGTTTAALYSSSHPAATEILLQALDRHGLRAITGPTLMDRDAPPALLQPVGAIAPALEDLCARWHDHDGGRLRLSAIPRFALSCTPALLRQAAAFAEAHGLLVQTHVSENLDEIAATRAAFPGSRDYLGVYEDHGLVGPRTILAHCIHFSDDEWARVRDQDMTSSMMPSRIFCADGIDMLPCLISMSRSRSRLYWTPWGFFASVTPSV